MKRRGRGRPAGSKDGDGATVARPFHAWPIDGGWSIRIGAQPGVRRGVEISILVPCLGAIVEGRHVVTGCGVVRVHKKTIAVTP